MSYQDEYNLSPPEGITDPLAQKVSWKPETKTSAGETTSMQWTGPKILKVQNSMRNIIGSIIYIISGFLSGVLMWFFAMLSGETLLIVFGLFFGIIFIFVGINSIRKNIGLYVFDFNEGILRCRNNDHSPQIRMDQLYAVQIIQGCSLKNDPQRGGYEARYELNIVQNDATRISLIVSKRLKSIQRDGEMLAKHLHIPLWDALKKD